jgi:peroxidase
MYMHLNVCLFVGDKRVNVVPALGWSHTCFMREHNRIAQELVGINPDWDDETIFQQTRRIMAAILQVNFIFQLISDVM